MDENTLAYHTKLHQWYELHRLNRSGDMASLKLPEDGAHLTPQKAVEIDLWRKEVNKIFIKPKKIEKKSEFWRCHMSAPTSATKYYSNNADPRRVKSARFFSNRGKPGVVDINALPSHLAEMSIHYNRERRGVYTSRFSAEDLLVKGKKQELHLPQFLRAIRGQGSDEGASHREGGTDVSIPQLVRDCDVTIHESGVGRETIDQAPVNRKALVCDRSQSNNLLNVMSIDDCKMGLRYRPQRVINTHELERCDDSTNGDSNIDENGNAYPLRISQGTGSGMTPVSQTRINSLLSAQKIKHKHLVINGNNLAPERPQSAILARAFDTILQENSMLSAPLHPKEVRFFAGSKDMGYSPSGKHIYQRLNSTLKNKMNNVVKARCEGLKSKDSISARVQYNGMDSHKFSKRSTATESLVSDDAKQL
ncbi:uncharacterized protein [Haliotis cracherodii]|uniref:uncharacterized protein n=1 Tax=Haliotis cracherodii TaxID=6455 RepID=UPI0039E7C61C